MAQQQVTIGQALNVPLKVVLDGRNFTVRSLTLKEVFALAEADIVAEYIERMHAVAARLSDAEKTEYLASATAKLPTGTDMERAVLKRVSTHTGIASLLEKVLKAEDGRPVDALDLFTRHEQELKVVVEHMMSRLGVRHGEGGEEAPFPSAKT